MKTIALCIAAVSLAVGGSAFAAERGPEHQMDGANRLLDLQAQIFRRSLGLDAAERANKAPSPTCETVAKMKADFSKGTKITPLNIGQFHFMEGVYVATPPVSPPLPADNAVLVQLKAVNLIIWMKSECALEMRPTQVSDKLVELLHSIKPVAGEASDAGDSKDELHL